MRGSVPSLSKWTPRSSGTILLPSNGLVPVTSITVDLDSYSIRRFGDSLVWIMEDRSP